VQASIVIAIAIATSLPGEPARGADCVSKTLERVEAGRPESAVTALKKGAREGDERCKFILGMWSLSGTGMAQDFVAGSRWLRDAAAAELPVAQANLGVLYASGVGLTKDEEKAARWYRSAAEYGDPLGQVSLGAVTLLGIGVPKDPVEGYKWTSLAAAQGNQRARSQLDRMREAMTIDQIEQAKSQVAEFRPKERPRARSPTPQEILDALGIFGPPGEYERLFGF